MPGSNHYARTPIEKHPEYRALEDENTLLREELTHLLAEEETLIRVVKPNLLADYQAKIGAWELRALNAHIRTLRARRRLEMAQAAINGGRTPNLAEVDDALELEFLAWRQTLEEAAAHLDAARLRLKSTLPEVEAREIRKLYYALIKQLHPDLHPDPTPRNRQMWLRVQSAYQNGDVAELRALALLAKDDRLELAAASTLDDLRRIRATLEKQVAAMLERIEQLESQPPFTLREQLADETWLTARREEIEARIVVLDAQCETLEKQLQVFFPTAHHGKLFGLN